MANQREMARPSNGSLNLGRLDQTTTPSNTAARLRAAILDGTFPPGSQLREVQIAEELGISRAPLREAFSLLTQEGLVNKVPFRGTYVSEVSAQEMDEIASLRIRLEPFAIELALPRMGTTEIRALRQCLTAMGAAARAKDTMASIDAHMRFHRCFYEFSGHQMLKDLWAGWESKLQLSLSLDHRTFDDLRAIHADHKALLELVETGDMDAITRTIAGHVHGSDSLPDGSAAGESESVPA